MLSGAGTGGSCRAGRVGRPSGWFGRGDLFEESIAGRHQFGQGGPAGEFRKAVGRAAVLVAEDQHRGWRAGQRCRESVPVLPDDSPKRRVRRVAVGIAVVQEAGALHEAHAGERGDAARGEVEALDAMIERVERVERTARGVGRARERAAEGGAARLAGGKRGEIALQEVRKSCGPALNRRAWSRHCGASTKAPQSRPKAPAARRKRVRDERAVARKNAVETRGSKNASAG